MMALCKLFYQTNSDNWFGTSFQPLYNVWLYALLGPDIDMLYDTSYLYWLMMMMMITIEVMTMMMVDCHDEDINYDSGDMMM